VEVIRKATVWALPGRACPCSATVTFADPPPGAHAGSMCYGAVLNASAVVLTAYGNVPPQRAAQVMAIVLGVPGLAGLDRQGSARLAARLGKAGFDAAMLAALAREKTLAADARVRGGTGLDAEILDKLRQRYDEAADFGIIHRLGWPERSANIQKRSLTSGMDEFRARRVVDALRDRGVNAHLLRGGVDQFGVRVSLPGGREAEWDTDGTAGLEAQVMRDGMLVGYVPQIDGSEDFDESQIVDAIARTDYDQPIARQRTAAPPPGPALTREGGVFRRFLDGFRYR